MGALDSTSVIVGLSIVFAVIGVAGSLAYYFARYYVKTDHDDKELLTQKPVDLRGADAAQSSADSAQSLLENAPGASRTLGQSLGATRESLFGRLAKINFSGEIAAPVLEQVEEVLYTSDLGPQTTELLFARVREGLSRAEKKDIFAVTAALRNEMLQILQNVPAQGRLFTPQNLSQKPTVWMVVGINGAGKTTTIGKFAALAKEQGIRPMIAAGDTFRAAADAQLKVWAERASCEVYSPENVKDPSAVAYAALEKAKTTGVDLLIVDTAGRLHTQGHLMAELQKMVRVMQKLMPEAPHEKLLVLDANAGQNALIQAREFHKALGLTGVIITKLDGSSKAGVAIGIAHELNLPIQFIGVGESLEDLRPFEPKSFVEAII